MKYCEKTELYLADVNAVDVRYHRGFAIVVEGKLGLWRPVIFQIKHGPNAGTGNLIGVCSGLVLVPTRNEAFERGKEIIDEIIDSQ